jgi:hypothetical protein
LDSRLSGMSLETIDAGEWSGWIHRYLLSDLCIRINTARLFTECRSSNC